jgi:hypothetical protein
MTDAREMSIIRQHSQEMAIRILSMKSLLGVTLGSQTDEEQIRQMLKEWTDWFQQDATSSAPGIAPPQQQPQRQGNGGQRVGFASPKQENWFKDLVGKAGLTDQEKHTVWEYASAALTGGRNGGISQAIDGLKSSDTAGQTARDLLQRAELWKAQQSDLPAPDTAGLA